MRKEVRLCRIINVAHGFRVLSTAPQQRQAIGIGNPFAVPQGRPDGGGGAYAAIGEFVDPVRRQRRELRVLAGN